MEVLLSRFVPIKIQNFIVTALVNKSAHFDSPLRGRVTFFLNLVHYYDYSSLYSHAVFGVNFIIVRLRYGGVGRAQ